MQNLLSSEKRTLDHWATDQLFFSLAQVRCFWRCLWFRSGLVALFLKMSERGDSWCTDSSFSSLLVNSPKCLNQICLTVFSSCGQPCCLCTFSYSISSFQSTLHVICFDTALFEQPPLSVMTLCDLPSLWRMSMIIFWTIAKSAVFPIILVSKNKRYPEFILYGWIYWSSNVNILIFWDNDFSLSLAVSSNHQSKKTKKLLKCFTLHVMNQKYLKISLFEINYKKKCKTFSPYSNVLRCTCK